MAQRQLQDTAEDLRTGKLWQLPRNLHNQEHEKILPFIKDLCICFENTFAE